MKYVNTVLIVDDDPGVRDTLKALLGREEYQLTFASCGQEALEKAQKVMPSVILLDVMMPEMDGFEVCQRLRAMPLLAEAPIIMLTACDDRNARLRGIQSGADDFLSKPFDREELRVRIRTILRLNRYRRLHQERAKFEWVVQHARDGYLIINDQDKIVYANSHARHFLGMSSKQQEHEAPARFLPLVRKQYLLVPEDAWKSWAEQSSYTPYPIRYLVRPESQSSEAFWLQVEVLELPSESKTEKVLRLLDVTPQIKAQRNRWGFHTMICHKLRTPLVGILGSLEFLMSHFSTLGDQELLDFVKMAYLSTQRLHSEIEDILQYLTASRRAKAGTECCVTELPPIIEETRQELQLKTIKIAISPTLPSSPLPLSRQAIKLILWEILENAVKFHPTRTPEVNVVITGSATQEICIQIQDNGITLSPFQLSQLWIPYYQAEKFSTGEISGMGLGLAMVATLIWEVGGQCQAYNRLDQPGLVIELHVPFLESQRS
ncbi:signal transduction histidine kinase [Candidatus Vecturithrix granuli]|uniref:histidine kinase n=1 Tax=Vecturithrix granuli TaxID=1499967 RepID=A0A081BTW1_VECG1|nr:signal transduction histidine kinase [Candidatus Vecturithrix granuli]